MGTILELPSTSTRSHHTSFASETNAMRTLLIYYICILIWYNQLGHLCDIAKCCPTLVDFTSFIAAIGITEFTFTLICIIMSFVCLVTVPNNKEHPDKSFTAIQAAVTSSQYAKMSKVDVPNLVVGTLDSLMSLADELNKIGIVVEVRPNYCVVFTAYE